MKILVTGNRGYIGAVLAPMLLEAGHEVTGLDVDLYAGCDFGEPGREVPTLDLDLREVEARHCEGFDAVIHLAALSNDPLGDLDPELTYEINHRASIRLARAAKAAGVERFLFSSSCSLYGASGDGLLDEDAPFHPVTAYGESKVLVERDLAGLADERFTPVSMRNATVYGASPRLRADVVVNNLVGYACTTGEVLIKSDGSPWRPLVHVRDVCAAFLAVLEAPREAVHGRAFNVGRPDENYRIREVADIVAEEIPGSRVEYAPGGSADTRNYRVDFSRLVRELPAYAPEWTVRSGVQELRDAFARQGLSAAEFLGPRYYRIQTVRERQSRGELDARLARAVAATG